MSRNSHLFSWTPSSKPRVYSRSQRVTSTDDIKGWMKKVEEASEAAAAEVFGDQYTPSVPITLDNVQQHANAYSEAQALIQEWTKEENKTFDDPIESALYEDEFGTAKPKSAIKKEWDHLVEKTEVEYGMGNKHFGIGGYDPYADLEEEADNEMSRIIQTMLNKDVVKDSVKKDLGLVKKKPSDPRAKMAARQRHVKETREKREEAVKKRRLEMQMKKEAESKARLLLQKEKKQREAETKQEEEKMHQEMARLRKELADKRKKKMEDNIKKLNTVVDTASESSIVLDQNLAAQIVAKEREKRMEEQRQRKIMERIQLMSRKNAAQNLKLLHRCFSSWYNLVMERRIGLGQARAMADWRMTLKYWRIWHSLTKRQLLEKESENHRQQLQIKYRNENLSEQHYHRCLQRKCFLAWLQFVELEQNEKVRQEEQIQTKNKMAAFLNAAASGQLWSKQNGPESGPASKSGAGQVQDKKADDAEKYLDAMFKSQSRNPVPVNDGKTRTSSKLPTEAWQVNKRHLKLNKEELSEMSDRTGGDALNSDRLQSDNQDASQDKSKPWNKPPFKVKNMENRHAAQQKILENQQKQIAEQQRLIEELTYLQKQQMHQQQAAQSQLTQALIASAQYHSNIGKPLSESEQNKMQNHLESLREELLEESDKQLIEKDSNLQQMKEHKPVQRHSKKLPTQAQTSLSEVQQADDVATPRSHVSGFETNRSAITSASKKSSRHDEFVSKMEARAAERAHMKQERENKRRKQEAEKLAQMKKEQEERLQKEEEEKQERIKQHRERKRQERLKQEEKEREERRMRELISTASRHHLLASLKFRGWLPWRKLVALRRDMRDKADMHYRMNQMRHFYLFWLQKTQSETKRKEDLADKFNNFLAIKHCFENWKKCKIYMTICEEKAHRHFRTMILTKIFFNWREWAESEKVAMWHKERQAKEHNTWRLKKWAFNQIRTFPARQREEENRARRREEMRKRVSSLLPDFSVSTSLSEQFE